MLLPLTVAADNVVEFPEYSATLLGCRSWLTPV